MSVYLILLLGAIGLHSLYFNQPLSTLYFQNDHPFDLFNLQIDVILGVSIGLLVVALSQQISIHFKWAQTMNEEFADIFRGISLWEITGLAVMSSVTEEVLFRGMLQEHLGLLLCSLVFGLLHVPMKRSHWPWTAAAILMGGVFGGLYEWRHALTAPLIAHFTINYFNLNALATLPSDSSSPSR
jgi:membrane protease YdiL (CAAX protease family)